MASRNIFLPKESNRRIPNGTYGGVRGMNNLYSITRASAEMILYAELTAARQHSAVRFEGSLSLAP